MIAAVLIAGVALILLLVGFDFWPRREDRW